ncbi:zinc finger MYM-type protein 2-like [Saccostrea cucullata]|uniref:zinc finger MYM-type protein 2-like n=1 Tax=Saccostrea cuccullata TaxID=36930 RepID=UPI002ED51CFD
MRNRQEKYGNRGDLQKISGELLTMNPEMLNYSLGAFITEVRKENGEEYRGNTLYEIIIAIQHHLRENSRYVTLMDDIEFERMRKMLDKKMKDLASSGVGIERKQSEVISVANENYMWEKCILGTDTPEKLRDTLLFLLGLNFALRGGAEHYNLRYGENSQLKLSKEKESGREFLAYTEDISKCNSGGINHRKLRRKQTKAYENLERPDRCVVSVFKKYISLRPKTGKVNALYLRARAKPSNDEWYCDVRVGINTLSKVVKNLCAKAGLDGHFTNHSLRATAATRMYSAELPEQLICEKTGHRSDAVREYKRTNTVQQQEASDVVQLGSKRKCENIPHGDMCDSKSIKIKKGDISVEIPL